MNPYNIGMLLENKVHYKLILIPNVKVLREADIKKLYGMEISGIDHIIELGDKRIYIQDKFEDTYTSIRDLGHFYSSITLIEKQDKAKYSKYILLSKIVPSDNGLIICKKHNIISIYNYVINEIIISLLGHIFDFFYINNLPKDPIINILPKDPIINNVNDINDINDINKINDINDINKIIIQKYNDIEEQEICKNIKLYDLGNSGFIDLYYNYYKDILVCISEADSDFYLYNTESALWDIKTISYIHLHFIKYLESIEVKIVEYYRTSSYACSEKGNIEDALKYDKKINIIKYKKTRSPKKVLYLLTSKFYNNTFFNKINNIPELLSVKNGIVNLQTGILRNRVKEDYCSFELDIIYNGIDYCTDLIDKFMNDILLNNKDMILFVQKLLGYSITGYITEQRIICFYGSDTNSKNILHNMLMNLMKKYYVKADNNILIKSNKESINSLSPHLIDLIGKRVSIIDVDDENIILSDSKIKLLTSGSDIKARGLYSNSVIFKQTSKYFLLCDNKPITDASDRKIINIPFVTEYKNEEEFNKDNIKHRLMNNKTEEILLQNLDQFLVWLVKGSVIYFKDRIGKVPNVITSTISENSRTSDELCIFIDEICEKAENMHIYNAVLLELYSKHTNSHITSQAFAKLIKEKEYKTAKLIKGKALLGYQIKTINEFA